MNLFVPGTSTMAVFLFFIFISPLGIAAEVVDRPNWDKAKWETELESFRRKYDPAVKGGVDGPIPELIECALKFQQCNDEFGEALVNEILLRKQFKTYNEKCNSAGTEEGELEVNPPKSNDDLDYPKYLIWQEKLINSELQFCDPHKFLRCYAEEKCVCLLGSVRVENMCLYSHGSSCTGLFEPFLRSGVPDDTGHLYFDPFQTSDVPYRTVQILTPGCKEKRDKCIGDFTILFHRDTSYCVDEQIFRQGDRYSFQLLNRYFSNLRPLSFNEACNSQDHNRLFTSTKQEDENHDVRYENLQELRNLGTKFCDLKKFLTCGSSEKCECISPSSRKGDKCVLPDQLDKCQIDPSMEPILMNETLVLRARQELMVGLVSAVTVAACERNQICHADMMEMYCTCPPGTTGLECEETLTKFLPIVRVPSLPTDVAGYHEKIKFFGKFNNKVLEFDKMFRRRERFRCVWETQNEAEYLVVQIRKLMFRGTTKTKDQYQELSRKIQNFTTANQNTAGICKETLRCQYSTKKCVRETRLSYLQDLGKELLKSKCQQPGCSKFLKRIDAVGFVGEDEYLFYGGDHEMLYNRIMEQHSKFCAIGGCSLAQYCHLPNLLILLMSVATSFVVSNY